MEEILLYVFGFWRFAFSAKFRLDYISNFKRMKGGDKALELLNAVISIIVGVGLPAIIIFQLYNNL
jgi:hypothetical protein